MCAKTTKFRWRNTIACQKAVHLLRGPAARRAGIAQEYLPPRPSQNQSRAQSRWTCTSDHDVPPVSRHWYQARMRTALFAALRLKFLPRHCSRLRKMLTILSVSVRKGAAVPGAGILGVAAQAEHAIRGIELALSITRRQSTASF